MPADVVVCFSHLRWGFVYQRPNHLMSRAASQRRVFFVEEPVFDASTPLLDVRRVGAGDLHVVIPRLRPRTPRAAGERIQRALLDELAGRARIREPILWMYTPMALGIARRFGASVTIYDCMDELSLFHGAPPELGERERELFARADVVFTGGHSLWEAKRAHHPNVHPFPSSVEAEHFARARRLEDEPPDQRPIGHPRIGYFGVIDERLDRGLLRELAESRPDWNIVLVGPFAKVDPQSLPRRANIHYLGPKPYAELPAYLAGWDVAVMPFALNDATRFISPTKTLEYLAAGKPVVSTPIRDVVRPYGERGLVRIAATSSAFEAAIAACLAERGTPSEDARRASCDAFVARTSWDATWSAMLALVHEAHVRRRKTEELPCSIT